MKRVYGYAVLIAGLVVMLSGTPSWGQAPAGNDTSDSFFNTGGGTGALGSVPFGIRNTAYGYIALFNNLGGSENTAYGVNALFSNTHGGFNTAIGNEALAGNTTGGGNTAIGVVALSANTTGLDNTAIGHGALRSNNGGYNIAVGSQSGSNLRSGDHNIYLGSFGPATVGSESDTLRLGSTQTRAFIAGVFGTPARGKSVVIDPDGQLGTKVSSARYKRDIAAMGASSDKLLQLRPVTFTYTADQQKVRQYGLIAEEVATVYPELVTRTSTGEVEGVDYEALIPMLLNELQRQKKELHEVAELKAQLQRQQQKMASLEAALVQMLAQQTQTRNVETYTASLAGLPDGQTGN